MSNQGWAIFGALVVAIVSGALQLWIARQNRMHASAERLRDVRREAYSDWIKFISERTALMIAIRGAKGAERERLVGQYEKLSESQPALEAAVRLVASLDTYGAFVTASNCMSEYFDPVLAGEPDPRPHPDYEKYGLLHEEWYQADRALVFRFQYDIGAASKAEEHLTRGD